MNTLKKVVLVFVCLLFFACQKSQRNLYPEVITGGMELLSLDKTGIDFNNSIQETETFNHFFYSQIYNGAGLAIGDINNDGLADIFFCGNTVSDRLYLNKGNFRFEDITKKSKAGINYGWSSGVTMVDINNDGYLDIYVSRGGNAVDPLDRQNQLYINNQDLTFTESAFSYGLADAGFSTQAVFFDLDNDGDLDMYQINQPPDQKLFQFYQISKEQIRLFADKLYKNENGKFIDISNQAGISADLTYGLSVNAADFNNDGFVDLYVANDYEQPDFMYYNNGNGTFKNVIHENLKHISNFSMGSDVGDINNDGLMDLFTLDMSADDHYRSKTNMGSMSTQEFKKAVSSGRHYQYMYNTLQVNTGNGHFYDIANMAGVGSSDWSWAGLIVDLDNDGFKDLVISNGIKKDIRNNDYITFLKGLDPNISNKELFQVSQMAPSNPLPNYIYKNNGNLGFEKVINDWGFDKAGFSSGMAYGDLDNDGDLDLVVNNMGSPAFLYENKATGNYLKVHLQGSEKNKFGFGAKAIIHHNGKKQVAENFVTRGYFSSVEPGLFFGLGKDIMVEKVEVIWPDGKINNFENISANKTIIAKYSNAKHLSKSETKSETIFKELNFSNLGVSYIHQENEFDEFKEETLLPHNVSQNGPFIGVADVNKDGLDDLFIGGAMGQGGALYLQIPNGHFVKSKSQPWQTDSLYEDLGVLFLDVDGDNDLDLYIASGGSEYKRGDHFLNDRLYINDGFGQFEKNIKALPPIYESTQCVKASDVDNDGDLDLFVGTRLIPGKYPFPGTSYLLINEKGKFKRASTETAPDLNNIGMVTDAVFTDIDQDGDQDLMLVGEWMQIVVLENNKGKFSNVSDIYGLDDTRGLWWSIEASDLDNDGDDDYVIGNLGRNNKFKSTKEHPFKVYANDFDDNGTNDVVLSKFYKDDYVPLRGRECTSQQMPFVAEKFKDYHTFASSNILDILPEEKIEDAVIYEIDNFESIILINENGKFLRKPLPVQTQVSPIKSSIIRDFNDDGFKDLLIIGNHYGVEVETVRYDAGIGALVLGDGNNNFKYVSPSESGFYMPYDGRDIINMKQNDRNLIIVSINNGPLKVFNSPN